MATADADRRRCAFLTLAERGDFVIDDEHAYEPLAKLGWQVDAVPWNRAGVDWTAYDLVVIRSTWDYQADPAGFLEVLSQIERSNARLVNPSSVVKWNLQKTYLRDLAERGVEIVPTAWRERLGSGDLESLFEELASERIVIKPQVGANADGAFDVRLSDLSTLRSPIEEYYAHLPLMAQPFATSIQSEGEFSLFYFDGQFSHAILKTPRTGDFRCQEEHGADIKAVEADAALGEAGRSAVDAIGQRLLYARVDFVRSNSADSYWLMELELIEPSLYLRMHPEAPVRFADAIDRLVTQSPASGMRHSRDQQPAREN